jgi:hypothetical protein
MRSQNGLGFLIGLGGGSYNATRYELHLFLLYIIGPDMLIGLSMEYIKQPKKSEDRKSNPR